MTWADIAAGRKPTSASAASTGRSAAVVPAVPVIRQATGPDRVTSVTAGVASMGVNSTSSTPRAPAVGSNVPEIQSNAKQGTYRHHRGGNKNAIKSAKGKEVVVNPRPTDVPLEEFHLFPNMPLEIRLKVYQCTMSQQRRLIELEWGPNLSIPTGLANGSHHWVRVCPRSRQPPALMHVCRESREEAQKVYQLRCFDSPIAQQLPNNPELHEHYIWYNPKTDIIFFGEETCVSTYISVFTPDIEDIPAIAIVNSGKGESCCDHDDYTYGVEGGVDTLEALHGFDSSETVHDYRYGGCPGLREVFVVVKSKLWPYKQGEVDASMTVRPATNDGLTKGQARFKARLERYIARVDAEIAMPGVGENVWIDDKKPTFKFVSFAKAAWGVDPREPDGMTVSRKDLGKLRRGDWGFMKRTQANTRCEIFVPDEEYPGEDPREIGFWGVRKSIDAAKKAIEERLTFLNSGN